MRNAPSTYTVRRREVYAAKLARTELRLRQNAARGFEGLHGAKRVARGDYVGGYLHLVVTADGNLLCPTCVREDFREIAHAYRNHERRSGWYPEAITHDGNLEGFHSCAHCGCVLSEEEEEL